jgi:hypothetical protein
MLDRKKLLCRLLSFAGVLVGLYTAYFIGFLRGQVYGKLNLHAARISVGVAEYQLLQGREYDRLTRTLQNELAASVTAFTHELKSPIGRGLSQTSVRKDAFDRYLAQAVVISSNLLAFVDLNTGNVKCDLPDK